MPAIPQLRFLHWNIHFWQDTDGTPNLDAISDLIREIDPLAVSLTEVDTPRTATTALDQLAGRHGYTSVFVPTFEYGEQAPTGGFGNAILTKLPITAVRQWQLVWPPPTYDGTEPSEPRSVLLAQLDATQLDTTLFETIWFGTTHLPRHDPDTRTAALQRLSDLLHVLPTPWVIAGDFNTAAATWSNSATPWTTHPRPAIPTHPTHDPTESIDYYLASPGLGLQSRVLRAPGSDHLPVLAQVVAAEPTAGLG